MKFISRKTNRPQNKKALTSETRSYFLKEKCKSILVTIVIIIAIIYHLYPFISKYSQISNRQAICSTIMALTITYFLLQISSLFRYASHKFFRYLKNWGPIISIIAITLAIPIWVHYKFFSDKTFTQETLLAAYTEYLSFLGALGLGYYLYKREEFKNFEVLKKKARLIYESLQYITINLNSIDFFIEHGNVFPIAENWKSDYLDIKHLVKYEESSLEHELQYFFNRIESINKAIVAGDKARAKILYSNLIQKEQYSSTQYNYMNAAEVMLFISLDIPQQKTWKENEIKQIRKHASDFFEVVNLWIYNYLIKNQLTSCDLELIKYELVDWLLQNPELKAWVKHPYDNRKISAMVSEIALSMNKKSENLNYYWGEFSFK